MYHELLFLGVVYGGIVLLKSCTFIKIEMNLKTNFWRFEFIVEFYLLSGILVMNVKNLKASYWILLCKVGRNFYYLLI